MSKILKTNKLVKALALVLCVVALVGGSVAGTLAYLSMKTETKETTFTAGNINISLTQATLDSTHMVPGYEFETNPQVTVVANSEKCYLFVEVEKTPGFDTYLTFAMADGWTQVEANVYYREVDKKNEDQKIDILLNGKIIASTETGKADYDLISKGTIPQPQISLTAYAVQFSGFDSAAVAWTEAQKLNTAQD